MLYHAVFCLFFLLCSLTGCAAESHITGRACSIDAAPASLLEPIAEPAVAEPEPIVAIIAEPEPPPPVMIGQELTGKTLAFEVSGYTSDEAQTDKRPCEAADQSNICERKLKGELLCAASRNIPLGTKVKVADLGMCVVADHMNARYTNNTDLHLNIDWYFGKDTDLKNKPLWHKARKIGRRDRTVKIVSIPTPN